MNTHQITSITDKSVGILERFINQKKVGKHFGKRNRKGSKRDPRRIAKAA